MKKESKEIRINMTELVAVVCLAFAFIYRFNLVKVAWYYEYVVSLPVALMGITVLITRKASDREHVALFILQKASVPLTAALIYTFLLAYIKQFNVFYDASFLSRTVSLFSQGFYTLFVAASLLILFGRNAVNILFEAYFLSYGITILMALKGIGIANIISYLQNPLTSPFDPWFESHDLCISVGLLILFLLFYEKKIQWKKLLFAGAIFYFGYKRIAIFACLLTCVIGVFINRRLKKSGKAKIDLAAFGILAACLLYTFCIATGWLRELAVAYNINFMGRLDFYDFFRNYYDLSPLFTGQGYGFVEKLLEVTNSTVSGDVTRLYGVMGLHSDILRMYIELGFLGSLLYFFYYLKILPDRIQKIGGYDSVRIYFLLTIYAFITYTTDNTISYFIFQMTLFTLAGAAILDHVKEKVCESVGQAPSFSYFKGGRYQCGSQF